MTTPESDLSPEELRYLILNTEVPLILRKFKTNWKCFDGTLADWCAKFDKTLDASGFGAPLFERCSKRKSQSPQWERNREVLNLTATDFLRTHSITQEYWTALNYKRAHELPAECQAGIDFSCFGFPKHNNDFTFWLSSPLANTPCHYDTYGCNIVVQVYGRKSWLLFPHSTKLTTTRIPYEESSVYAQENFYALNPSAVEEFASNLLNKAYHCIMEPQDVLIVPHHWWHYVETLDTSLSINYWVPLKRDFQMCLEELIVKFLIESFVKHESENLKHYVLNPNQLSEITDSEQLFQLFEKTLSLILDAGKCESHMEMDLNGQSYWPYKYGKLTDVQSYMKRMPNAEHLTTMSKSELLDYLTEKSKRFVSSAPLNEARPFSAMQEMVINSICAPHIVERIKREFFRRHEN